MTYSAYKGIVEQKYCTRDTDNGSVFPCTESVVLNNQYYPVFWLPPHLNILDSALEGCWINVPVTDPPVALPTAKVPSSTIDAQPGVTPDLIPLPTGTLTRVQPIPSQEPEPPVITVGPPMFPFIPDPISHNRGLIVDPGTTIQQGEVAATIGKTTVSVGASEITISDNFETRILPLPNGASAINGEPVQPNANGVISIDGQKFTTDAAGNLVKPGTTLHVGDTALTISGTALSVGADVRATLIESNGRTTVIDNDGVMSILDGTGKTTVKHPSGTIIIIDTNGAKTIVDESGRTSHISPDGMTTRISRGGLFATIVATGITFLSTDLEELITNDLKFADSASGKNSESAGSKSSKVTWSKTSKTGITMPPNRDQAGGTAVPTRSKKGGADDVRALLNGKWWLPLLGAVVMRL
jgi:hypothetical protein